MTSVSVSEKDGAYNITIKGRNFYTARNNTVKFTYDLKWRSAVKLIPTEAHMQGLVTEIIAKYTDRDLFGRTVADRSNRVSTRSLQAEITRTLKNLARSENGVNRLEAMTENKPGDISAASRPYGQPNINLVNPASQPSIFTQEESAKTCLFWGKSWSGKTTILVTELNKLLKGAKADHPIDYIVIMTESFNSMPLKKLNPKLNVIIIDRWCPAIAEFFVKMNKATTNHFRVLLILDDIVSGIKNQSNFNKMLLTYRNNGISSCILLQDPKLVDPVARMNSHEILITNLHLMRWEFILKDFLMSEFKEIYNDNDIRLAPLALKVKELMKDKYMKLDQRSGEMIFYKKPSFNKSKPK